MSKSYTEIFYTNQPWLLNHDERKKHVLINLLIAVPVIFLLAYMFGRIVKLDYLPFLVPLYLMVVGWCVYVYYWDQLNARYGLKPSFNSRYPYSYSGYVVLLTLVSPAFFLLFLVFGLMSGNFWFGLGGALALVYPIMGMFLRIKVFSEDNTPDSSFGFMPIAYWILSAGLGFLTVGLGFSSINSYISTGIPSLEMAIVSIVLGLLLQTVYLFPDKIDKIVPFELGTKTGFVLMLILAFVLLVIVRFLTGLIGNLI
jgi:hypothetical protein